MSIISLRLPDYLLRELDSRAHACNMPRAAYIRIAIEHMNKEVKNKDKRQRLIKASMKVRKENMKINAEFSKVERDVKD